MAAGQAFSIKAWTFGDGREIGLTGTTQSPDYRAIATACGVAGLPCAIATMYMRKNLIDAAGEISVSDGTNTHTIKLVKGDGKTIMAADAVTIGRLQIAFADEISVCLSAEGDKKMPSRSIDWLVGALDRKVRRCTTYFTIYAGQIDRDCCMGFQFAFDGWLQSVAKAKRGSDLKQNRASAAVSSLAALGIGLSKRRVASWYAFFKARLALKSGNKTFDRTLLPVVSAAKETDYSSRTTDQDRARKEDALTATTVPVTPTAPGGPGSGPYGDI
jgi:hypothetical protein